MVRRKDVPAVAMRRRPESSTGRCDSPHLFEQFVRIRVKGGKALPLFEMLPASVENRGCHACTGLGGKHANF
jgi:hypothetical protein